MIDLFLTACLIAQPATCETFYVSGQEYTETRSCAVDAQLRAAQWIDAHPDWRIRRVSCRPPSA